MADAPIPDNTPEPGETIIPGGAPRPAELRTTTLHAPEQPATPAPFVAVPSQPEPQPAAPQNVVSKAPDPLQAQVVDDASAITWTASEFIAHEKSANWYMSVALGGVLVAGLIYLLTKDLISSVVVVICAVAFGYYGSRQPRQLKYVINGHGIGIGDKFFPYHNFRSFSIVDEGAFSSISFMPLKRFAPAASIYYAPEDENAIVDVLADQLPFEEHVSDPIDRLMRKIRF